jgi:hypothetical protein
VDRISPSYNERLADYALDKTTVATGIEDQQRKGFFAGRERAGRRRKRAGKVEFTVDMYGFSKGKIEKRQQPKIAAGKKAATPETKGVKAQPARDRR